MAMPTILTGAAGRALRTLGPLTGETRALDALVRIGRATPDMKAALGSTRGIDVANAMMTASKRGTTRTAQAREQIRLGLDELQGAARETASRRMMAGTVAIAAGVGGALALATSGRSDEPPRILTPGPFGAPAEPQYS